MKSAGMIEQAQTSENSASEKGTAWFARMRQDSLRKYEIQEFPEKLSDMKISDEMKKLGSLSLPANVVKSRIEISHPKLKELKSKGFVAMPIAEAVAKHSDKVMKHLFSKYSSDNKLLSMNAAYFEDGIFIYVPEDMDIRGTVELKCGSEVDDKTQTGTGVCLDRILVVADKNSKVTILQNTIIDAENDLLRIEAVEVFPNAGSKILYANVQSLSGSVHNFSFKGSDVKRDASMIWVDSFFGGKLSFSEVMTDLKENGAHTDNLGLFYGTKKQRFGIFIKNIHSMPNTVSDMLTKGVLDGHARSIYNGTVRIAEHAHGSNGYQRQDVLLLSSAAGADAKPNLEIDNNDVRCTHGVSIGQVDKEKMFYLMSRGLNEQDAKLKIVEGFYETMLRRVTENSIRQQIQDTIEENLLRKEK